MIFRRVHSGPHGVSGAIVASPVAMALSDAREFANMVRIVSAPPR